MGQSKLSAGSTPLGPSGPASKAPRLCELSHEIELPSWASGQERECHCDVHSRYAHYLDDARAALLARYDYGDAQMLASGYAWPIVEMHMRYMAPFEPDQPVRIRATIVEWEHRLGIDYLVSSMRTGKRLHRASSVQVALEIATGRMCWASPSVLREKLGIAAPMHPASGEES